MMHGHALSRSEWLRGVGETKIRLRKMSISLWNRDTCVIIMEIMQPLTLILAATVGLAITAITSQAQMADGQTTSSHSDGAGNTTSTTISGKVDVTPPHVAVVITHDGMMAYAAPPKEPVYLTNVQLNPDYITYNTPVSKTPSYNHDGRAFANYIRSSPNSYDDPQAYAGPDRGEYAKNVKSGKWRAFKNGED
jgi:hypothetical protein